MQANYRSHNIIRFYKYFYTCISLCLIVTLEACTKFVQVDPPKTQITSNTVYSNNTTAAASMTGIYGTMMSTPGNLAGGNASISLDCGLTADELKNYYSTDITFSQFYANSLQSSSNGNSNNYFWQEIYTEIHLANAVLEGVAGSAGVTASMKQQLSGEAKFIRAFLHFYAVNLYGDVPLVLTTDYLTNNSIHRSTKAQVYQQIVQDLKDAQANLSDKFLDPSGISTTERVRPNKGAATALLARVYLYLGDWVNAEAQATAVISNTTSYALDSDLTQVFLKNSTEAIWQLQPVFPNFNTFDAYFFVLTAAPGTSQLPAAVSSNLLNTFEAGDNRLTNWIGNITDGGTTYYYPFKYKVNVPNQPMTEYLMVLRLAEQYLIRAEARAQQNNSAGAVSDLNVIRNRAGLANYSGSTDQASLLKEILHERQVELFTEWGHRWFDLKRTGLIDGVMSTVTPLKGGTWSPNWALFPLPLSETQVNPNLVQNPGYQ